MKKAIVGLTVGVIGVAALFITNAMFVSKAQAADYSFANVSINKFDWSDGSQERGKHLKNYDFIELEGGAGYSWGDLYGFADFENFSSYGKVEDMQVSLKGVTTLNTVVPNLAAYQQTYAYLSKGFKLSDTVVGASYQIRADKFSMRPFLGVQLSTHNADFNQESFGGLNGGMFGWTMMYDFNIGEQKFQLTNWHEMSFARDSEYLRISGESKKIGQNGAVGVWWHVAPRLTTGVQYRYADQKLGVNGYANGAIYTVKFNF